MQEAGNTKQAGRAYRAAVKLVRTRRHDLVDRAGVCERDKSKASAINKYEGMCSGEMGVGGTWGGRSQARS